MISNLIVRIIKKIKRNIKSLFNENFVSLSFYNCTLILTTKKMKKQTQMFTFALLFVVSLYACNTKKDDVVVATPTTGFTATQVAGTWKLTAASSFIPALSLTIPDVFDTAESNLATSNADGRAAFCTKNSILALNANGSFTENFVATSYTFGNGLSQTCPATQLAGTFAIPASSSVLTITYTGGTPAPRSFTVKTVTATTMTIEINASSGGVASVTTGTYVKQ
jgi:hypothetical protein